MSGMAWRIAAKIGVVSHDGRLLESVTIDPERRYRVVGRDGAGVLLRIHRDRVQIKVPKHWKPDYALDLERGPVTYREIDGRTVMVFAAPEVKCITQTRNAWDPRLAPA